MKKNRKHTISYTYQNNKKYPSIKLVGKWLQERGFNIGDKVEMTCCNGVIMLVKTK